MKHIYIIDANGTVWGSFDSVVNAVKFGNTLEGGFKFLSNNSGV